MGVRFSQLFPAGIFAIVFFTPLTYAQQNPALTQPLTPPSGVSANHSFSQAYRIGGPTTSIAPMPLVEPSIFPLFIEDNEISSLVTLINGSAVSSSAVLTIRDLQGKTSLPVSIPVGAHGKVQIKVADLLQKAGAQIRVGSILVTQGLELKSPAIVGQLTLSATAPAPVALTEEELVMPMLVDSQDLRSVSESATDAQLVAVTSMSTEIQHITAQCYKKGSISTKTATLAPGGVTLLYPCSKDSSQFEGVSLLGASETSDSAGITIHSDGPNGGFAAFGVARHVSPKAKGSLGSLQFVDPTSMHSSALVFTGVSTGYSLTPGRHSYLTDLALANFSSKQSHVTIAFHKTHINGTVSTTTKEIVLAPQSSTQVPLGQFDTKAGESGSLIVSGDQLPGDLMAKIVSTSDSARNQLEQVSKDALDDRNGGAHPWILQDSTRSDLVLFNHSSHTEPFNTFITTEDGAQWSKSLQLAPFETRVVSIDDLIRGKVADSHGRTLPATAWSGSVVWQTPVPGTGSGHVLIRNDATASGENFSCGIYSSICGGQFTANTTVYSVGQTASFGDFEAQVCLGSFQGQCSGTLVGTGNNFNYFWQSDSPGILSISGGFSNVINLHAASPGSSLIEATVSDGACSAYMAQAAAVSSCPAPPTTQSTDNAGADPQYPSVSDFTVTLSGGSGNFAGWTVGETNGAPGADSCWNPNVNPAFVPEYPSVTGTSGQANAANQVLDRVGWLPASVSYIRSNSPHYSNTPLIPTFPCGMQMNQILWIECPGSTLQMPFQSTTLTGTVYSTYVQNCRQGVCPTINY